MGAGEVGRAGEARMGLSRFDARFKPVVIGRSRRGLT